MTHLPLADYGLAAAGLLGHSIVLLLLFRRRLSGRLAAFSLLMALYLLRSALFLLPGFFWPGSGIYWLFLFTDPLLQVAVMLSFGLALWRSHHVIVFAVPCLLVLAGFTSWLIGPSSHYSAQNLTVKLGVFVSALWIQAAVVLCLVKDEERLKTKLPLGIVLGFAAYSVVNIVTEAARMHYTASGAHSFLAALSYSRVIAYLCCLAGWCFLLWTTSSPFHQFVSPTETARS